MKPTRRGFLASLAGLVAAPVLRVTTELGMLAAPAIEVPPPPFWWHQVDAIFKEFYLPGIKKMMNGERLMARMFRPKGLSCLVDEGGGNG